ncbi:DUF6801 domain-containing protein [Nocardioides piscis]|uniref:DUF6801 domain-containing protein n=1 Tax=Nocardioides piscis TaxID=2714938 RepID=A0A6G7YD44_9ACTN|nr:DUF6801 domain-containing protein [Nocardioides piscis]QIK74558.1 hypothetical protein G7071_03065 [Nocardioides piscis]
MVQHVPTRRTVVRTAAWSVPAISVISAAPAFASSPGGSQPTYQDITKSFIYTALGTIDILVEVTAIDVPLTAPVGATLKPIQTNSKVTIPANLAPTLRSLFLGNADQVSGTSTSVSELTGAITISSPSNLTIPLTPFPRLACPWSPRPAAPAARSRSRPTTHWDPWSSRWAHPAPPCSGTTRTGAPTAPPTPPRSPRRRASTTRSRTSTSSPDRTTQPLRHHQSSPGQRRGSAAFGVRQRAQS